MFSQYMFRLIEYRSAAQFNHGLILFLFYDTLLCISHYPINTTILVFPLDILCHWHLQKSHIQHEMSVFLTNGFALILWSINTLATIMFFQENWASIYIICGEDVNWYVPYASLALRQQDGITRVKISAISVEASSKLSGKYYSREPYLHHLWEIKMRVQIWHFLLTYDQSFCPFIEITMCPIFDIYCPFGLSWLANTDRKICLFFWKLWWWYRDQIWYAKCLWMQGLFSVDHI